MNVRIKKSFVGENQHKENSFMWVQKHWDWSKMKLFVFDKISRGQDAYSVTDHVSHAF